MAARLAPARRYARFLEMLEPRPSRPGRRSTTRRSTTRRSSTTRRRSRQKTLDEPRRGRPGAAARPTRSSASRSASRSVSPASPSTPSSTASRWRRPSRTSSRSTASSSARSPRRCSELPRAGAEVPRLGRALLGQLLRRAQLRRLHRRLLRVHPEGRALPDGALDLLPDQRRGHRPVRAHADRRRRGRVRELPRGLHGADARREPAARGGRRARRARRRRDQVLDGPELVPGRRGGPAAASTTS